MLNSFGYYIEGTFHGTINDAIVYSVVVGGDYQVASNSYLYTGVGIVNGNAHDLSGSTSD